MSAPSRFQKTSALQSHRSMMMGVWLATSFIGNFGADYPGNFWSSKMKPSFFLMIAGVALAGGAVIWAFNRPLP